MPRTDRYLPACLGRYDQRHETKTPFFAEHAGGCRRADHRLGGTATADTGPANRFDYAGATPVQWWRLDGAGHAVPSRTVFSASNPATGTQNRDVEFAEVVWAFFKARLP